MISIVLTALFVGFLLGIFVGRGVAPTERLDIDSAWVSKVMSDAKHSQKERDGR